MAGEMTMPILPCNSIDEVAEFYRMLGFEQTYRQTRPNPSLVMRLEDIHLHFGAIPGFVPADSYGSCVVLVPDIGALFAAFAEGMRAVHGKLLISGIPRMTRPRKRKNADNLTGFLVVDPGGNWIRFHPKAATPEQPVDTTAGRLRKTLDNAVVMADSHGDNAHGAKILDGTLAREQNTATPVDLVDALTYRAELAVRMGDPDLAGRLLDRSRAIPLTDADRVILADALSNADELQRVLRSPATD
ncbi:VOC family protein [Nocardia suismassiliense]|uniref:VOC family protein n=1 Tax=Nocardia suismassiliense TaxID=2077092 RepID=A0ABW6QQW7_9NOCA